MKAKLLMHTRKTVAVSGAPPKGLASSFLPWRRAAAPFALLMLFLLTGAGSLFAGPRVFFGFGVGPAYPAYYIAPPPPPVYAYAPPPAVYPGPGYVWINGYWNFAGGRYAWAPGYYSRAPFRGAYWVGPRYYGGRYYRGYWGRR